MTEKVAVVTGCASGLGRAIATQLAAAGVRVHGGSDVEAEKLPAAVSHQIVDIGSDDSVQTFKQSVLAREGRVDILVNNAAYALAGPLEETPLPAAQAMMNVNFFGMVRVCQAFLPALHASAAGRLVNISSGTGFTAEPYAGFYSASKFAIEGYTEALRHELHRSSVKPIVIEPGWLKTPIFEHARFVASVSEDYRQEYETVLNKARAYVSEGLDPAVCARRIVSIIGKRRPKLRYRIGTDVQSSYWSKKLLPQRWYEYFVRQYYSME